MSDLPEDTRGRFAAVPPALVEEVMGNPDALRPVARAMAAVNLHNLFVRMQSQETSNNDRMEFQKLLNKVGDLEPEKAKLPNGPMYSLVIQLPDGATTLTATPRSRVLEGEVEDGD